MIYIALILGFLSCIFVYLLYKADEMQRKGKL